MKESTLFYDGWFHPMKSESEVFRYLGVTDGKITWLSNNPPDEEYGQKQSLGGRHAYPAMIDSHLHLTYSLVLAASSFTVCEVKNGRIEPDTLTGVKEKIMQFSGSAGKSEILVGNNFIVSAMKEKRLPTRQELDEWSGGRAMVVYNIDGHSSSLSTAMLEKAGISSERGDGILKGKEHEFNQGKITTLIGKSVTPAKLAKGIANFTNECTKYGISHVCALDGNGDVEKDSLTRLMAQLFRRMELEVRFFPQYMDVEKAAYFRKYQRQPRIGGCGEWEMDGSVGSHSAAFYEPYADSGTTGECYYEADKLETVTRGAAGDGYQISSHAIGEAAIDRIAGAMKEIPKPEKGPLHRIDHFEFPSEAAVRQVIEENLAVTVQPGFSWLDRHYLHSYRQFLPEKLIKRQVPLKRLMDAGVCVCGSSDSPVQSINPFEQMLGMVDFYIPEQSLSPYEALCTYTKNAALMLGESDEIGTLENGKRANFFLTEKDILNSDKNSIGSFEAEALYIDGKKREKKCGKTGELFSMLWKKPKRI